MSKLDYILERLQLFAKDHPVDMTNGDIKDRENATQAIKDLMLDIVGEDYEFERPKEDYLPNQYIHLKAKNELRQQLRQKIEEL